jgi:hypothetical protein
MTRIDPPSTQSRWLTTRYVPGDRPRIPAKDRMDMKLPQVVSEGKNLINWKFYYVEKRQS